MSQALSTKFQRLHGTSGMHVHVKGFNATKQLERLLQANC